MACGRIHPRGPESLEQLPLPLAARPGLEPPAVSPPQPPPRRRRWPLAVLLLGLLAAGGWLALPLLAAALIEGMMEADTGADARLRVVEVGPHGLVLAPLVLGDDLHAERVEVRWRLPDLLGRRLERVTLSGVRAEARLDRDGLSLGAVDRLIATQRMSVGVLALPEATARVRLPWGERRLLFDAQVRAGVLSARGDIAPLIGAVSAVPLELTAERRDGGGMSAELAISGAEMSGRAAVDWAPGLLRAQLHEPLRLSLAEVPAELSAAAPEPLRPLLAGPLSLTLRPAGAGPALDIAAGPDGRLAAAAVTLEVSAAGAGGASLDLDGDALLDAAGWPIRLAARRVVLEAADLPYGDTRVSGVARLADVSAAGTAASARLRLMLVARRFAAAGLSADEAALAATGDAGFEGGRFTFVLSEPGSVHLKGARAPAVVAAEPLTLAIASGGRLGFSRDGGLESALTVTAPRLAAVIGGRDVVAQEVRAALSRSAVDATATVVRLGSITLPLAMTASLRPDDGSFTLALRDRDRIDFRMAGRHDAASGSGTATVTLRPVAFAPAGLQPRALFPDLAGGLQAVGGSVAIDGALTWGGGRLRPQLDVLLQDFEARAGGVVLRRLNGVVRLTGLAPAASPPGQMLAVALIDAGLPLTDGRVTFRLDGGRLVIEHGSSRLAGGQVTVAGFVYDPQATRPQRFSLEFSDIDLGRLVALIDVDGLTATGRLAGNGPVSLSGGRVTIDDARLISLGGGSIRYRPEKPPAFFDADASTRLVLKAFDNFEYDKLTMTLNGTLGGELAAGMTIAGANPGLYGGYPIELNLNLSGRLDRIIDEALVGYQIPDQIKERMSWFGVR